ncbi:MAG TPA: 3-oxoacid CoA-transferase subunit A [Chloroflexota bacterium]|nr:3-oxoacid CoA-transferase subunit A [Chloroflexota bacterium]
MNKVYPSAEAAVADVPDGATIMVGGFGSAGVPEALVRALAARPVRGLTVVSNGTGEGESGLVHLIRNRQVRRVLASFPAPGRSPDFEQQYLAGEIELELVPQGTLAERIRAGGAGLAAFYTPTGVGTPLAEGKEQRTFDGRTYLLEHALRADFAFVRAHRADPWGNLVYRKTARNFNPVMAMAARVTIAEVEEIVPVGALDPETIVTPGIFVHRVVVVPRG